MKLKTPKDPYMRMMPPIFEESERAVLSVLIKFPALLTSAQGYIKSEMFSHDAYKAIYRLMCDISSTNGSFDMVTLSKAIQEKNKDLMAVMISLSSYNASSTMLEQYCKVVIEGHIKRSLVNIFHKYTEQVHTNVDIADIYEHVKKDLDDLFNIDERDVQRLVLYEQAVLSACMNNTEALSVVADNLTVKMLYKDIHKNVFLAMKSLYDKGKDVSVESLLDTMDKYNLSLSSQEIKEIPTRPYHDWDKKMRYIVEANNVKMLNTLAMSIINRTDTNLQSFIERVSTMIDNMRESFVQKSTAQTAVQKTIRRIRKINKGEERSFLFTHDKVLNEVAFITPDSMVAIAGPQGAGKTRYVIKTMKDILALNKDISILWYSMEDSDEKIIRCFISSDVQLDDAQMLSRNYTLTQEQLQQIELSTSKYSGYDIEFVNDSSSINAISSKFKAFCKSRKDRWCLLIIDNFMLIKDISEAITNSTAIEDNVMAKLKQLRTDTNKDGMVSSIFLLHHLTKDVTARSNKEEGYRPKISNMKGTTRVADTCSIVILINNIAQHKDLIREHSKLPDIQCLGADGEYKLYKRSAIMNNLIICDVVKNREGTIDDNRGLTRYLVDFKIMKFNLLQCKS